LAVVADTGFIARGGWNLPKDFGPCPIRPGWDGQADAPSRDAGKTLDGVHFFAGILGSGVAHNIFLDGNTFRQSHRVDREPWVGDALAGIGITLGRWQVTYAHVFRSKEFSTQTDRQVFGSLSFSFTY